jgi:hypothetical protein
MVNLLISGFAAVGGFAEQVGRPPSFTLRLLVSSIFGFVYNHWSISFQKSLSLRLKRFGGNEAATSRFSLVPARRFWVSNEATLSLSCDSNSDSPSLSESRLLRLAFTAAAEIDNRACVPDWCTDVRLNMGCRLLLVLEVFPWLLPSELLWSSWRVGRTPNHRCSVSVW